MSEAKKLFCVRIYLEVAKVVVRRIKRANHWNWPCNEEEWRSVARHFGYIATTVYHLDGRSKIYYERKRIVIQFNPDRRLFYRDFAHEVAHAILNETRVPKGLQFWPADGDDTHYTAQLVEQWVDLDFAERSQQSIEFEQE